MCKAINIYIYITQNIYTNPLLHILIVAVGPLASSVQLIQQGPYLMYVIILLIVARTSSYHLNNRDMKTVRVSL